MTEPSTNATHVIADDREAASGVIAALQAMDGVTVAVARLRLADYEVDGTVLFERKRLPDFVASIEDGRLFRQAIGLAASGRRCALILEGTSADLAGCQMRRESIQGALISVSLIVGLPVLRATGPAETARLMVFAARQVRAAGRKGIGRGGHRPTSRERVRQRILMGLPGIAPKRASLLLARFGSVEAVIRAHAEELQEIAGIGPDLAARIRWAVEEEPGAYAGF